MSNSNNSIISRNNTLFYNNVYKNTIKDIDIYDDFNKTLFDKQIYYEIHDKNERGGRYSNEKYNHDKYDLQNVTDYIQTKSSDYGILHPLTKIEQLDVSKKIFANFTFDKTKITFFDLRKKNDMIKSFRDLIMKKIKRIFVMLEYVHIKINHTNFKEFNKYIFKNAKSIIINQADDFNEVERQFSVKFNCFTNFLQNFIISFNGERIKKNTSFNYLTSSIKNINLYDRNDNARNIKNENISRFIVFPNSTKYISYEFSQKIIIPHNTIMLSTKILSVLKNKARKLKILHCETCILDKPKNKINDLSIFKVDVMRGNNFEFNYDTLMIKCHKHIYNFTIKKCDNIIINASGETNNISCEFPEEINILCVYDNSPVAEHMSSVMFSSLFPKKINYLELCDINLFDYEFFNAKIKTLCMSPNLNLNKEVTDSCESFVSKETNNIDFYDKKTNTHTKDYNLITNIINKSICV
jgi:hypothetical protein